MTYEELKELSNILTDLDREEMQLIGRKEETTIYTPEDLQDVEKLQLIVRWLTNQLY